VSAARSAADDAREGRNRLDQELTPERGTGGVVSVRTSPDGGFALDVEVPT